MISFTIQRVSGVDDFSAQVAAYYCLATWLVRKLNQFPILNIIGPNGTGKTQLLNLLGKITFRPRRLTATGITGPALRDILTEAHEGTVIIDEADNNDSIEKLLNNRYIRDTAVSTFKVPGVDGKGWDQKDVSIFGPSIVHKRVSYSDAALEGRSVSIKTFHNQTQKYIKANDIEPETIHDIRDWEQEIVESTTLPESVDIPDDVAPRVADTYRPLIALASAADDQAFLDTLWSRLRQVSENLKDGQLYEPAPTVLRALIATLTGDAENIKPRTVKIEKELRPNVFYEFGLNLNSRQIAEILRGFDFTVKKYAGSNAVSPDLITLIRACDSIGLKDEVVERARAGLRNHQQGDRRIKLRSS